MLIYLNGSPSENAQQCWASSVDELTQVAKSKFGLVKQIKYLYSDEGKIVILN